MSILCAQLELTRPAWLAALALLPVLILFSWRGLTSQSPATRFLTLACRILLVTCVVLALAGPQFVQKVRRLYIVLAVDQSDSVAQSSTAKVAKLIEAAEANRGPSQVVWLPFAATPSDVGPNVPDQLPEADRQASNLAHAIEAAAASIPRGYAPRVVLASDGLQTDGDALSAARSVGVPVWTVPLDSRSDPEVYAAEVTAPLPVRVGVPLDVEVHVHASRPGEGTVELARDDQSIETRTVRVQQGENRFRFAQTIESADPVHYRATLTGFPDTIRQNNTASALLLPTPKPRVLLVESRAALAGPLAAALSQRQIDVDVRKPDNVAESYDDLRRYDLLVLSNVPAAALGSKTVDWIRGYVAGYGGGLIVIGGMEAFTAGGYHGTNLEQLLPVVCQASGRRRKPTLAMVLVIDRSLSMKGAAIELAKQATRRAVELLDPQDQVGVLAFDETAEWISPLGPCTDKAPILQRIGTIEAQGRTDTFPALDKAYLALNEAFADRKHIILLTDGISHPGDFDQLARQIADSRITLSTVAVGKEAAGPLLENLAREGHGRYYYCDDPAAVPKIFAIDTASAGRPGINEEPFFARPTRASSVIAGLDIEKAPTLLGYVETQAKPGSQQILATESDDPLLIWWRCGHGNVAAFTSDVETRWAAAWLRWPGFGPFWAHLARHTMRRDPGRDFHLRIEEHDRRALLTLDALDPQGNFLNDAMAKVEVVDPKQKSHKLYRLFQSVPGRYAATIPTPLEGDYRFDVQLRRDARQLYTAQRGLVVGYPDELRTRPTDVNLLQAIAKESGGRFAPKAGELFELPDEVLSQQLALWPYLLGLAGILLVVDLGLRRLGLGRCV